MTFLPGLEMWGLLAILLVTIIILILYLEAIFRTSVLLAHSRSARDPP
jgi:hypothetical protein